MKQIPLNLSIVQASALLLIAFTVGAAANSGRAILMRLSGQRIVARLRERTYDSALRQEIEYVEKWERLGDDCMHSQFQPHIPRGHECPSRNSYPLGWDASP